jgi:hypothetical protein
MVDRRVVTLPGTCTRWKLLIVHVCSYKLYRIQCYKYTYITLVHAHCNLIMSAHLIYAAICLYVNHTITVSITFHIKAHYDTDPLCTCTCTYLKELISYEMHYVPLRITRHLPLSMLIIIVAPAIKPVTKADMYLCDTVVKSDWLPRGDFGNTTIRYIS